MRQYYRVSFYTIEGGRRYWSIDITANRCGDAKKRARDRWQNWPAWSGSQMFKVRADRLDFGTRDVHEWFTETGKEQWENAGNDAA